MGASVVRLSRFRSIPQTQEIGQAGVGRGPDGGSGRSPYTVSGAEERACTSHDRPSRARHRGVVSPPRGFHPWLPTPAAPRRRPTPAAPRRRPTPAGLSPPSTGDDQRGMLFRARCYRDADADLARKNYHMTSSDVARLASRVGPARLVLFHASDRYDVQAWREQLAEVRRRFDRAVFPQAGGILPT